MGSHRVASHSQEPVESFPRIWIGFRGTRSIQPLEFGNPSILHSSDQTKVQTHSVRRSPGSSKSLLSSPTLRRLYRTIFCSHHPSTIGISHPTRSSARPPHVEIHCNITRFYRCRYHY